MTVRPKAAIGSVHDVEYRVSANIQVDAVFLNYLTLYCQSL